MITLALDSCFDACSAALASEDGVVLASAFEPMTMGHAERLVPMITEVIDRARIGFSEVDRVAVTIGPGTFTGTRIGVAAARGLALALDKELIGETSLAVMAETIADDLAEEGEASLSGHEILIATDARRDEVYCQLFRAEGVSELGEPRVVSPAEAASMINPDNRCTLAGSGAPSVAAAAAEIGLAVSTRRPELLPDAAFLARRVSCNRHSEQATKRVAPLYLRPADAKPQSGKSIPRVSP